jgi:tetratricopeptide (TPR) repeat protein
MTEAEKIFAIGNELFMKGRYAEAAAHFSRTIDLDPKNSGAYTGRGIICCLYFTERYDSALSDFNQAITLNPRDALAYHGRGLIFHARGFRDLALKDFSRVIELNPRWGAGIYRARGQIFHDQELYEEAVADFTAAIELNSEYAAAYYNRALSRFYQGDYKKAWEDACRAQYLGYQIEPGLISALVDNVHQEKMGGGEAAGRLQ